MLVASWLFLAMKVTSLSLVFQTLALVCFLLLLCQCLRFVLVFLIQLYVLPALDVLDAIFMSYKLMIFRFLV